MQSVNSMQQAKIAIRAGHFSEARRLLQQLVYVEPQNYKAWLLLARVASSPRAAREYVLRAKMLQPDSALVQRELLRLDNNRSTKNVRAKRPPWRTYIMLTAALVALILLAAWLAPLGWERALALKDTHDSETVFSAPTITPWPMKNQAILVATEEPTLQPTPTLEVSTNQPTPTAEVNVEQVQAASMAAEDAAFAGTLDTLLDIAPIAGPDPLAEPQLDEATSEVTAAEETVTFEAAPDVESYGIRPSGVGLTERWIDVNLNTQSLVAYEGDTPVFNSLISSGMWNTPTVTGQFQTNMKYEKQDMNGYLLGYDYYLEDVPYVMYFFEDYAIHGTYWHNNFGTPMSHGCVNMDPVDAGWLFNWAPVGTTVNIHN